MDRFREMQVFVAVVDSGSFVKAADTLRMSKAAVSRHVTDLEARLGVRLLQRTTRRLSLTQEGQTFHGRCNALLADVREAEAEITSRRGRATGLLRVNVPVSYGLLHLAALWPAFMSRHPQVELDITLSDRLVDLVEEGYDLAVRIAHLPSSSLISRKLSTTRMVLCASPSYIAKQGSPGRLSELARHRVLAYTLLSTGDEWRFTGPEGAASVMVKPRLRSNSGDTCRAAAVAGQGIILQPEFLVHRELQDGSLAEILPQYRGTELGVYAVYPSRRHVSPKVRVLIDYLAEALRADQS